MQKCFEPALRIKVCRESEHVGEADPHPTGLGGKDSSTRTGPLKTWGLDRDGGRQICQHKRELGREPVPGRRRSRRAAPDDRQEATKRQHKQEAGPLVTGWGPARAGKSPERRRGRRDAGGAGGLGQEGGGGGPLRAGNPK